MNMEFVSNYFVPMSILDVGANVGEFYLKCKAVYPDAYYYLIEANENCEAELSKFGVDYFIGAMSNVNGFAPFYMTKTSPTGTGNSLYRELTNYYSEDNIIVVEKPTFTLETILPYAQFDLIKLDVQGAELDILKGGIDILRLAKGVIMEVAVAEYNVGAPREEECLEFMKSHGFSVGEIVGVGYSPETRELVHRDIFFIRDNHDN